jgi:hypothetical protein
MALSTQWDIEKILNQTATREAVGQPPLQRDAIAGSIYASNLAAREDAFNKAREYNRYLESDRQLKENQRQFNISDQARREELDLKDKQATNSLIGSAVSGLGQAAITAPMAYKAMSDMGWLGSNAVNAGADAALAANAGQAAATGSGAIATSAGEMAAYVPAGATEGTLAGTATTGSGLSLSSAVYGAGAGIGASLLTNWAMREMDIGGRNERDYATNIAGGAAAGFTSFGPIGAAVGAVAGGVLSIIGEESVICTELFKQGYISKEFHKKESLYGFMVDYNCMEGYHKIAKPIVKLMKKSPLFAKCIYYISRPVLNEMASQVDTNYNGSLIGSLCLKVLKPICKYVGKSKSGGMSCLMQS